MVEVCVNLAQPEGDVLEGYNVFADVYSNDNTEHVPPGSTLASELAL